MWRKFRTFFVVTIVSILIWLWAESETVRASRATHEGQVGVGAAETLTLGRVALIVPAPMAADPSNQAMLSDVVLSGPRGSIEAVRGGKVVVRVILTEDQYVVLPAELGLRVINARR